MGKSVSAADANRDFSKLLRDVRKGGSFIITNHGKTSPKSFRSSPRIAW